MMYGLEVVLSNGAVLEFSGSEQVSERISIRGWIAEPLTISVSREKAHHHYFCVRRFLYQELVTIFLRATAIDPILFCTMSFLS